MPPSTCLDSLHTDAGFQRSLPEERKHGQQQEQQQGNDADGENRMQVKQQFLKAHEIPGCLGRIGALARIGDVVKRGIDQS